MTEDGIVVDEQCRTADPDIFAAGDVAEHPHPPYGTLRLESVQNALDQAKACAASMLYKSVSYAATPWFWSDQFDVKFNRRAFLKGTPPRSGGRGRSRDLDQIGCMRMIA